MKYVSKDQNDPHRYDDLLNMERPLSQHKALSMAQRAAQFASFDALVTPATMAMSALQFQPIFAPSGWTTMRFASAFILGGLPMPIL